MKKKLRRQHKTRSKRRPESIKCFTFRSKTRDSHKSNNYNQSLLLFDQTINVSFSGHIDVLKVYRYTNFNNVCFILTRRNCKQLFQGNIGTLARTRGIYFIFIQKVFFHFMPLFSCETNFFFSLFFFSSERRKNYTSSFVKQ